MPMDNSSLQEFPLFQGLPDELYETLRQRGRVRTYKPETNIINQEESGDTLYIILRGIVKVSLARPDGREVFLAVLSSKDHFGELSLIDDQHRSANVVTQDETSLMLIDRNLFHDLTKNSAFAMNLCRSLAARFRNSNKRVSNLALMSVQGLVAHHILEFAQAYGQPVPNTKDILIPIRLTQNDLADLVGASRERVNQVIKQFKDSGAISVNVHFRIIVHRVSELKRCLELQ